ncbi:LPS-assembly protein LptD [Halobacteriovorax marinus]|uniref:LPS-assembly protein LptD n=1 Tax=Halobacteriovorax marinus TaxID=97084 RepID=UPI00032666D6|nr:LPS-assembly protein LptD [Halobacteriovorax marinus]
MKLLILKKGNGLSLVHTTSLVKFKNILILALIFFSIKALADDKRVNFSFGNKVQVLSDKAYRRSKNNEFEAVGNVIINHERNSIYGEKASISFKTGDAEVLGNVRYISSDMTVFGSKMEYNFNSSYLGVYNGKIINSNYTVVGKYLAKISENVFIGREAEYTTCRDCPESWSILGKEVQITKNEYIRIKHAYIKVNGVVVMYVPYIVLPIKKDRESGLLFPKIKIDSKESVHFGLPYFWAISDHNDLTFTPMVRGRRGLSGELQFRQAIRGETWLELNTIGVNDRIWTPGKDDYEVSGTHNQRLGGDFEFHSFLDNTVNFHTYFSGMSDLDQVRDLESYYDKRLRSSDLGLESYLNIYNSLFDIGAEVEFKRNLLFENPKGFDHDYVQTLPRVHFNSIPFYLWQGDFFGGKSLSFQWKSEGVVFKQNHFNEGQYIRNATRLNLRPKLLWDLGYLGPVNFKSSVSMDRQDYWFSHEQGDKKFSKSGFVYENEASFEISKIFGLSYDESIPLERIDLEKSKGLDIETKEEDIKFEGHVGSVPKINESFTEDQYKISRNSYRYSQVYKLKHYYLADQKQKGSQKFANQIKSGDGQFDSIDSVREKEFELSHVSSRTSLPVSNTLELQWSNSLIKKYPKEVNVFRDGKYLRDNFSYSKVAYFDVSQGIDLNANTDNTVDKLTRLYVGTGFSLSNFSFSLSEYFYHQNNEHILNFSIAHKLSRFNYGLTFRYDSFTTPINKTADLTASLKLNDLFNLKTIQRYDLDDKGFTESYYQLLYSPLNNCWKADVSYKTTEIEHSIAFNFYINFNENKFYSLSGGE